MKKKFPKLRTDKAAETFVDEAERSGVPYQRFIRQTLENALHLGK